MWQAESHTVNHTQFYPGCIHGFARMIRILIGFQLLNGTPPGRWFFVLRLGIFNSHLCSLKGISSLCTRKPYLSYLSFFSRHGSPFPLLDIKKPPKWDPKANSFNIFHQNFLGVSLRFDHVVNHGKPSHQSQFFLLGGCWTKDMADPYVGLDQVQIYARKVGMELM